MPGQCPYCVYFHAAAPAFIDDSGYEILGFCRHPRIGMELFRPQKREPLNSERCPLFVRGTESPSNQDGP
jgi:hypothetical protein